MSREAINASVIKHCGSWANFVFRGCSFNAGFWSVLASLIGIFSFKASFHVILIYLYLLFCGGLIIFLEFKTPELFLKQIGFYFNPVGRTLAYLLLGLLPIERGTLLTIVAIFILCSAFAFFLMFAYNYVFRKGTSIPPPLFPNKAKEEETQEEKTDVETPAPVPATTPESPTDVEMPKRMKSEVLFFPDDKMPCHYFQEHGRCKYGDECKYSHKQTNLLQFIKWLEEAKESISIAIYTISCNEIADTLIRLHKRRIKIRLITDNKSIENKGSDVLQLQTEGIECKCDMSDEDLMHHKFAVIDNRIVLNGSFNWTRSAVLNNDENVMKISDHHVAKQFSKAFEKMWEKYVDVESGV